MTNKDRVILNMSEEQASLVERALEFYARSYLGQLDLWHIKGLGPDDRLTVEHVLKNTMGLNPNASFGIYNQNEVDDQARQAFDIHTTLRHSRFLSFSDEDKETMRNTVMSDPPRPYSYDCKELPTVERTTDENRSDI